MLRLPRFRFVSPPSIEEAIHIRTEHPATSMYVAGGTDVYPKMKRRQFQPEVVIAIGGLVRDDFRGGTLGPLADTLPSVAEEGPLPLGPLPLHARIDEQRGLHDDVRITKERRARLLVLAAHDDAALVRVERDPHESAIRIRFITNERRDAPDRIAFRRLRFHDVRAKVGEDAAALRDRGRGPLVGVHDLDDAKAVENRLKHRWA